MLLADRQSCHSPDAFQIVLGHQISGGCGRTADRKRPNHLKVRIVSNHAKSDPENRPSDFPTSTMRA